MDHALITTSMNPAHLIMSETRNYTTISPSAKSLLLMKGQTNIPYAKELAALMQGPEVFDLDFDNKDFRFWMRVMHFEKRYWSIDQLLKQADHKNILELSSGYSLRGLDMCAKENIHYIDTDLPEVIAMKRQIIKQLGLGENIKGKLDLFPLNALDKAAFNEVVAAFDEGAASYKKRVAGDGSVVNTRPLTIVNEGLLMYLNTEEKKRLCHTIYNLLKERGGYWITADIYPKLSEEVRNALPRSKSEDEFMEQHRIEENKFDSYEAAELFFKEQGFEIVKEADVDVKELSAVPHLLKTLPPEIRNSKNPPPKIQATWMLKAI